MTKMMKGEGQVGDTPKEQRQRGHGVYCKQGRVVDFGRVKQPSYQRAMHDGESGQAGEGALVVSDTLALMPWTAGTAIGVWPRKQTTPWTRSRRIQRRAREPFAQAASSPAPSHEPSCQSLQRRGAACLAYHSTAALSVQDGALR
jgi:hypothetical protein